MMLWIRLGAVAAVLAGLTWSHASVYRMGVQSERTAALVRSLGLLRERNVTDDTIRNMDDAELCAALGGRMSDDGACQ